ncbi:MAG: 4-hydroxythreonine-4-phosphate dehydrogenase PdxA, partial [Novosphingobium sp.]
MSAPLAVSLGDPAGVGPELLAQAWLELRGADAGRAVPFFAVGGARILAAAATSRGLEVPVRLIDDPAEAAAAFTFALPVLVGPDGDYAPGEPTRAGAQIALASLTAAAGLAVTGQACGIVTGPIAKSRLA